MARCLQLSARLPPKSFCCLQRVCVWVCVCGCMRVCVCARVYACVRAWMLVEWGCCLCVVLMQYSAAASIEFPEHEVQAKTSERLFLPCHQWLAGQKLWIASQTQAASEDRTDRVTPERTYVCGHEARTQHLATASFKFFKRHWPRLVLG